MQGLRAQILLFRCLCLHYFRHPRGWCSSIWRSFTAKLFPFGSSQLYIQPEKNRPEGLPAPQDTMLMKCRIRGFKWQLLVGIEPDEKGMWCLLPIPAWYYPKEIEPWHWGPGQRQPPPDDWLTLLQPTGKDFNTFKATFSSHVTWIFKTENSISSKVFIHRRSEK